MPGRTYTPIATTKLTSSQNNITFSGISGSFTDLVLVCQFSGILDTYGYYLCFNGDTTTASYSSTSIKGNGSASSSTRNTSNNVMYIDYIFSTGTNLSTNNIAHIMNYSNTTTYKTVICRGNNTDSTYPGAVLNIGQWRNTAAITNIQFGSFSGGLMAGSTITLYGITAA